MNDDLDILPVKSDKERFGRVSEKLENFHFLEERAMNLSDGSENDVRSNGSSSRRTVRRSVLLDSDEDRAKMKSKGGKWLFEEDIAEDKNLYESSHVKMEKEFEDLKLQSGDDNGFRRSSKNPERIIGKRIEIEEFQRAQEFDVGQGRYPVSRYSEEGPSNYRSAISDGYIEPSDIRIEGLGYDTVDYSGDDRAELLRKLGDLEDQLRRSGEMAEKPKEKPPQNSRMVHHDPYSGSEDWFSDSSSGVNRPFMQFRVPDHHGPRPPYRSHYAEPSAYMAMHELSGDSFYPTTHARNHVRGVGDPLRSQMPGEGPRQAHAHAYSAGHYLNKHMVPGDPFGPYPPNINQHPRSCTCYYCYNKIQVPQPHISTNFDGKRLLDARINPVYYHHENFGSFGPHDFDPRIANMPPLKPHNLQTHHSRWPSDRHSEVGSIVPEHPPRMRPSNGGQRCRPMTGGAPFLTCYNCFELLQVPKKVLVKYSNPKKLRCGACSTIIVLRDSNKRLVYSIHGVVKESIAKANNSHIQMLDGSNSNAQSQANRAKMTFSSEDYDHSAYDFQSMDGEPVSHLSDHRGSVTAEIKSLHSTSSYTSEDEANLDIVAASRKNSNLTKMPVEGKSHPPAGSSVHNGDTSTHSKQGAMMPNNTSTQQNSMKDVAEPTEIDISSNEFGNTGTSIESGEASREGNQLRANKAAEYIYAGFSRSSFRDPKRSDQKVDQENANVTVNGHLIPDRLIKKAEKLAGPIQPGHYWYDFRAGFWGVTGSPCLGIIPPFIEEFNFPLQDNCADGNTSVFVNGRELNKKDLNLLASRGLSNERNRSYIVEISGRVLDANTGEELESLGKLAPTVEKLKRGFGMKPPKVAA